MTYGIEPGANLRAEILESSANGSMFNAFWNDKNLGRFRVGVAGKHNVQNALAAIGVGIELGLEPEKIRRGLESFHGADRRFQLKAEVDGVRIYDDYGHHPTEIRATLEGAALGDAQRIWAIFQPHRYTRTKFLMDEFAGCFGPCSRVDVLDVYAASEPAIPGVTSERLVARMNELGFNRARYAPSDQALLEELVVEARPGDLILTIGAGNVWKIGEALAGALRARATRPGVAETRSR